jgi:uncharacterized protein with HEPN domain
VRGRESRRGDALRLGDIYEAIVRLEEIRRAGHDRFIAETLLQDAAIRRLEVVGEAAGSLSEATRDQFPGVPWRKMRGFASLAKHEYWRVDLERVWTAVAEIPRIRDILGGDHAGGLTRSANPSGRDRTRQGERGSRVGPERDR